MKQTVVGPTSNGSHIVYIDWSCYDQMKAWLRGKKRLINLKPNQTLIMKKYKKDRYQVEIHESRPDGAVDDLVRLDDPFGHKILKEFKIKTAKRKK